MDNRENIKWSSRVNAAIALRSSVCILLFLLFTQLTFGQVVIRHDTLTYSQTWVSDTTYIIDQDLYVPQGITLQIRPGVTILINEGVGIFVEQGSLLVSGIFDNEVDSVLFRPNYLLPGDDWKWKGIKFKDIAFESSCLIEYACITNTEIAIEMDNCRNIFVRNSSIVRNQWRGIKIFNSRNCVVRDTYLSDGYVGIEIYASGLGNEASFNLVNNCLVKQQATGVLIWGRNRGLNTYNLISNSKLINNDNGIQLDNGISLMGKNIIERNIIWNKSRFSGYAIQVGQDSTEVKNNLLWRNNLAVDLRGSTQCLVSDNYFFENLYGLTIGALSQSATIYHNTFSENVTRQVVFNEAAGINYLNNNHISLLGVMNSVQNETVDSILIRNNFWGASIAQLDQIILDANDNNGLGELIYLPVRLKADTSNPVSVPLGVIKQWVDDKIRISWNRNPEQDVDSYRIYAGQFINYRFSDYMGSTSDSLYFLTNHAISDSIAVTAADRQFIEGHALTDGHESPYVFARLEPYAGEDLFVCENQKGIELSESSAPFENSTIAWKTSGDGIFTNPALLHPVYHPGLNDIEQNHVTLILTVSYGVAFWQDSLNIHFYDFPSIVIGNDTTVFNDLIVKLVNVKSEGYDQIHWISLGDGVFSADTVVNPVYTPGTQDILNEQVTLVLTATSSCGVVSDTLFLFLKPFAKVSGKVWYSDQPYSGAMVVASSLQDGNWQPVQLSKTDETGNFVFERLMYSNYLFTAIPDTLDRVTAIPTHYVNRESWLDADIVPVASDTYDIDIQCQTLISPWLEGQGLISGFFLAPSSDSKFQPLYCEAWFAESEQLFCEQGLSNVVVHLYNSSRKQILATTLTDFKGDFIFRNLAFGTYFLDAEIPGYTTIQYSPIVIDPDQTDISDIELSIQGEKQIKVDFLEQPQVNSALVYPNPASDQLLISLIASDAVNKILIFNTLGKIVLEKDIKTCIFNQTLTLDVSKLPVGYYRGSLLSDGKFKSAFSFAKIL